MSRTNTLRRAISLAQPVRFSPCCTPRCYSSKPEGDDTTHFGFRTIPAEKKEELVGGVFSSVAKKYDTMNDIMSLYTHRLWKDHFVRTLNPGAPNSNLSILDVAGGTGDIAFRLLEHATKLNNDHTAKVRVVDINADMLKYGKRKVDKGDQKKWAGRIEFTQGNAEILDDVKAESVGLYTIAFGIRNVTHIDRVLDSAYRVLKPGGVFACLEFSKPTNPIFASIYQRYSFTLLPLMGQIVAGDRDAYQYLVESIERFPKQEDFAAMIEKAGFKLPGRQGQDAWENLTGGIVAIHRGIKL